MSRFTEDEIRYLTLLTFKALDKKCFIENKKPTDFIGRTIPIAIFDDNNDPYTVEISEKIALTFTELIESETKRLEDELINGTDGGSAPKGILSVIGKLKR